MMLWLPLWSQSIADSSRVMSPEEKNLQAQGYFLEGMKLTMLDEPEKALMQFKLANEVIPNNPGILFQMAQLYRQLGRKNEAMIHLNLALEKDGDNYHMINERAELLFEQNEYAEAAKAWEKVLSLFPENMDIYLSLAEAYSLSGDELAAAEALLKARQVMGYVPALMLELQRLLIDNGRFDEAVMQAKSWAVAEPENADASLNLAELYLSQGLESNAARVLRSYLEFIGENGDIRLLLTQLEEALGQSPSENEWLALMNNPQIELTSKIEIITGRYAQYLDEDPDTLGEALFILADSHPNELGVLALQADYFTAILRWGEAQTVLKEALKLNQGDFSIWKKLWDLQAKLQLWEEVKKTAEQAQIYFPSLAESYYVAALANAFLDDLQESEFHLSSASLYNAGGEPLRTRIRALELYAASLSTSKPEDSKALMQLFEEHSELYEPGLWATRLLIKQNRPQEALIIAKKLTEKHPNYLPAQQTLATALYETGKTEEALDVLTRQLKTEGHPLNGIILESIGDYYLRSGNEEEALNYWNRARENGRNSASLLDKLGLKN